MAKSRGTKRRARVSGIGEEKSAKNVRDVSDTEQRLKRIKLMPECRPSATQKSRFTRANEAKGLKQGSICMESQSDTDIMLIPMVTRNQTTFYNAWLECQRRGAEECQKRGAKECQKRAAEECRRRVPEEKLYDPIENFELPKTVGPMMARSKGSKLENEMQVLSDFPSTSFKSPEACGEDRMTRTGPRLARTDYWVTSCQKRQPSKLTQPRNCELTKAVGVVKRGKGQRLNACRMAVQKKVGPIGVRGRKTANPIIKQEKLIKVSPLWMSTLRGTDALDTPVVTRDTTRLYNTWLRSQELATSDPLRNWKVGVEYPGIDEPPGIVTRSISRRMRYYHAQLLTNAPIADSVPPGTSGPEDLAKPAEESSLQFKEKDHVPCQETKVVWNPDGSCNILTREKEPAQINERQLREAIACLDKPCQVPDDLGILKKHVACNTEDGSVNSGVQTDSLLDENNNPPIFSSVRSLIDRTFIIHPRGVKHSKQISDRSCLNVLTFNVTCESSLPNDKNMQQYPRTLQMALVEKPTKLQQSACYDTENLNSLQYSHEISQEQKINTMFQDGLKPPMMLSKYSTNVVASETSKCVINDNNIPLDNEKVDSDKSKTLCLNSIIYKLHEMVNEKQNEAKRAPVIKMYRVRRKAELAVDVPLSKSKQEHDKQMLIKTADGRTGVMNFQVSAVTSQPLVVQSSALQQQTLALQNQDTNVDGNPKECADCKQSQKCDSKYGFQVPLKSCPKCLQCDNNICYGEQEIRNTLKHENTISQALPSPANQKPIGSESTINLPLSTDEQKIKSLSFIEGISNIITNIIRL